jgi:hypothetical protein
MAEQPNNASRTSKAEGERWNEEPEKSGISNRPIEEETASQESVPPRGDTKPGANAGQGGDRSPDRSDR